MSDKKYWVWLSTALGAAARVDEIFSAFSHPKEIYESTGGERMLAGVFTRRQLEKMSETKLSDAENTVEICSRNGWNIVVPSDADYPAGLRRLPDKPLVLYVDGDIKCLKGRITLGVVGTRKPSYESIAVTEKISSDLAKAGVVVISGGALGIDSAAHQGALNAAGKTVCVLGCGLGTDYLMENEALRRDISRSGAVVAEYPPFKKASRYTFPERNRIISGMSRGVLVVEAGAKSGSLITAKRAAEQGRDVFAIPGSILTSAYTGVNNLIKDGARAVTSAADILEGYAVMYPDRLNMAAIAENSANPVFDIKNEKKKINKKAESGFGAEADRVYAVFGDEPLHPDDICAATGLSPAKVIAALMQLEIGGLIEQTDGKNYILKN